MKEDLIEKLTSMVFNDSEFSKIVFSLCKEINRESEAKLLNRLSKLEGMKPKHVGISPYLTLDSSSNMESEFLKNQQANQAESGDVGGSFPDSDGVAQQPRLSSTNDVILVEMEEAEIFNPQKDLEFELIEEEEEKEVAVPQV